MKYILLVLGIAIAVSLAIELVRTLRTYFKFRGRASAAALSPFSKA